MDCSTHPRGQAVIELTIVAVLVLVVVTCSLAFISTVKKEMKHDFLNAQSDEEIGLDFKNPEKSMGKNIIFFGREPINKILNEMSDKGWTEDRRLKASEGLLVLLSKGDEKMSVIKSKDGTLGVSP